MKLKSLLFNNTQVTLLTIGAAAFVTGCCSKGTGGSYSYNQSYGTPAGGAAETQEYNQGNANQVLPLYKEQLNVGTQQVDDGTVRIRKVVKTETVNQPVQLRRETLSIDREPSATGQEPSDAQPFQQQEIDIQLHHEEPVVSTQVVPAGQIVAQTRSETEQRNIQQQIRRESVDIDKGNAQNVTISENVNENEPMGGGGDVNAQYSGAATGTITDVTVITTASDPNSLDGRPVQFDNARVDRVNGRLIVVKDDSGKEVFIRMDQPIQNLQPGDILNITGTVQQLSPTGEATEPEFQGVNAKICVHAQTVHKVK